MESVAAPEYHFNEFITQCEQQQRQKIDIQTRLRMELQKWWLKQRDQDDSLSEQKHRIFSLLHRFRCIQQDQNTLIQKEKVRFYLLKNNMDPKDLKKMRNRLKYFIMLNQEHESIISKLREDCVGCRGTSDKVTTTRTNKTRLRVDEGLRI